ncbi:MAG: hypothetical protein AAFP80_15745, partial [Pseudomonadota bacterium]
MSDGPIFTGFGVKNRLALGLKWIGYRWRLSKEVRAALERAERLQVRLIELGLNDEPHWLAQLIAKNILVSLDVAEGEAEQVPLYKPLLRSVAALLEQEGYFNLPRGITGSEPPLRSEVWAIEDQLRRTNRILDDLPACIDLITALFAASIEPLIEQFPKLVAPASREDTDISFDAPLLNLLQQGRDLTQELILLAHAPDLENLDLALATTAQLTYNLEVELGLKQWREGSLCEGGCMGQQNQLL